MNTPLNNDTQQKARELARKITVAHDLDQEIQEELYGHIEDKLLAYKNGEERISDEDALILVREHFGNIHILREHLQEVHMNSSQVSLTRQLLALTIALMGLGLTTKLSHNLLALASAPFINSGTDFDRFLIGTAFTWIVAIIGLATLVQILRHWHRAEALGSGIWFHRWSIRRMVVLAVSLLLLKWALPGIAFTWQFTPEGSSTLPVWLMDAFFWGSNACLFLVWLWWTDATRRTMTQLIAISSICSVVHLISSSVPVVFLLTLGAGSGPEQFARLFEGRIGGTSFAALASYQGFPILAEFNLLMEFGFCASICTVLVWCVSRAIRWLRNEGDAPVAAS